ncbi:hypothetical protein DE146DRAFT_204996 [Phaeosphaeria sp. MPI-PUGE-AT-0046c]|nr:hypothetical protein DE146DRAFT_204996 [Phaeosphaeria sp. MPI-PUGE-AT-0046c]
MASSVTDNLNLPDAEVPPLFKQWKLDQQSLNHRKRKNGSELDNSLPDEVYYKLELDAIYNEIHHICSQLIGALEEYEHATPELTALVKALNTACIVPRAVPCLVAFLGQQGIGKSTIINARLGRRLVSSSASSSACTSIATYLYSKDGAPPNSKCSDVMIEILRQEHTEDSIALQITHYADAFPYNRSYDSSEDEGDDFGNDEDESHDSDATSSGSAEGNSHFKTNKSLKGRQKQAATAKDFFEILFDAKDEGHVHERAELNYYLENTDLTNGDNLREGKFFKLCLLKVEICRTKMAPLLKHMTNVPDRDLANIRKKAEKFWPLVRAMRITTGHRLLKHNIAFVDLPGYGDTNKIRNALIDECRDQADFEVVVAPSIRMLTTTLQQTYLARSIKRRGEARTLLVTNKSDELVEDIFKTVEEMQEQSPFTELMACLKDLKSVEKSEQNSLDDDDDDDDSGEDILDNEFEDHTEEQKYRRAYAQRLLKVARLAEICCEVKTIRETLEEIGINVPMIAVSARQYQLCKERNPDTAPILDIDATGIPALRQTLFRFPALNNLETLRNHVFLTLPALLENIRNLMVKFAEDDGHAEMRENLNRVIPTLQVSLTATLDPLVQSRILQPWDTNQQESSVLRSIEAQLTFSNLHYQSFAKMLRENGRPCSGVALGYDLNQMIHRSVVDDLETWKKEMSPVGPKVCESLTKPFMDFIASMGQRLNQPSGDPRLKLAMRNAYSTMRKRMDQEYNTFETTVKRNLHDTHFKFWSATSLYDPIVEIMRPIYHDTLLEYHRQPGKGVYLRQKTHIRSLVLNPRLPDVPLPAKFADDLVKSLFESWKAAGTAFVANSTVRLQEFAEVMQNIVDTEFLETAEHQTVVERLEDLWYQDKPS